MVREICLQTAPWRGGDVCPNCTPLEDSGTQSSYVQDYLGAGNNFDLQVSQVEPCAPSATQYVTAVLNIHDGITWSGSIYTDTLGLGVFAQPLNVVAGTPKVLIDTIDRTGDVTISLGAPLTIDLSAIGVYSNSTDILITYLVTASAGTIVNDDPSQNPYLFAEITLGGRPNDSCGGNNTGYFGTVYPVERGDLIISGSPGTVNSCESNNVILNVTGAKGSTLTENLVVTFSSQPGDIFTHTQAVFSGAFAATTPLSSTFGNTVVFTFPAGLDFDAAGTIQFPLYRPCNVIGPVNMWVDYQDRCAISRTDAFGHQLIPIFPMSIYL